MELLLSGVDCKSNKLTGRGVKRLEAKSLVLYKCVQSGRVVMCPNVWYWRRGWWGERGTVVG